MRRNKYTGRQNTIGRRTDVVETTNNIRQKKGTAKVTERKSEKLFLATGIEKTPSIHSELFTVILLHYNQQRYISESLESIFKQEYANIELIFADDCSANLDAVAIQAYVEQNRTPNISNVIYQINQTNCGTVNNVNTAIKSASGSFIMFFAADDKLYDEQVLNNFADALKALPEDQYMVSGQCDMMDEDLSEFIGAFVNVPLALALNRKSAMEQYQRMAFSCMYAMGATAFRKEMFAKHGYFDNTYKIIEDWSYFLHLTHSGSKIIFADFQALLHRDGGVSHFNQATLPPHVIDYKNDNLLIQEREILPFLSSFPVPEQVKLIERYEADRKSYAEFSTGQPRPSRAALIMQNKKFYLRKAYWWMIDHTATYRVKCIMWAKKLLPAWLVLRIIKVAAVQFVPPEQLMIVDLPAYDVVTWAILGIFAADVLAYILLFLFNGLFRMRRKTQELFLRNK